MASKAGLRFQFSLDVQVDLHHSNAGITSHDTDGTAILQVHGSRASPLIMPATSLGSFDASQGTDPHHGRGIYCRLIVCSLCHLSLRVGSTDSKNMSRLCVIPHARTCSRCCAVVSYKPAAIEISRRLICSAVTVTAAGGAAWMDVVDHDPFWKFTTERVALISVSCGG